MHTLIYALVETSTRVGSNASQDFLEADWTATIAEFDQNPTVVWEGPSERNDEAIRRGEHLGRPACHKRERCRKRSIDLYDEHRPSWRSYS